MRPLKLPEGARFSNKDIFVFLLPILFEQLMVAFLGMADTFVVSFLGETAVAGVALVNRIDNFAKQFFIALAQGGSVVLSQYIGAGDRKNSEKSLRENIRIVVLIGVMVMLVMVLFKKQVLTGLFGGAEPDVLKISGEYFTVTAFSYPFVALYYSGTSNLRAMGESRIPFISTVVMMSLNIALKYLFIFKMDMGVSGAAVSTIVSMGLVGFVLMLMMKNPHNKVRLSGLLKPDLNLDISKRILTVSVPNGIEQGMFQLGALMIAGLVSGLGTAAIAADSIARTCSTFVHCAGTGCSTVMMMVIGQCMGAKKPDEAKFYTKHILKIDYIMTIAVSALFIAFMPAIISVFKKGASPEAQTLAYQILLIYTLGSCVFYPTSFAVASALRATGDTKFVMMVSVLSMFLFRIGAAYIFVNVLKLGVIGTWVAMVSDWVIRSAVFIIRFIHGKWQKNKVI